MFCRIIDAKYYRGYKIWYLLNYEEEAFKMS